MDDLLDEDGYPTDKALLLLQHWPPPADWTTRWKPYEMSRYQDFWALAKQCWNHHYGTWREGPVTVEFPLWKGYEECNLYIATGGWSGNEAVIGAIQRNFLVWTQCWRISARGGAYWFCTHEAGDDQR